MPSMLISSGRFLFQLVIFAGRHSERQGEARDIFYAFRIMMRPGHTHPRAQTWDAANQREDKTHRVRCNPI
jgi:hypothetical protein